MNHEVYAFCDHCHERKPSSAITRRVTHHKYGPQSEEFICNACARDEHEKALRERLGKLGDSP